MTTPSPIKAERSENASSRIHAVIKVKFSHRTNGKKLIVGSFSEQMSRDKVLADEAFEFLKVLDSLNCLTELSETGEGLGKVTRDAGESS